MVGTHLAHEGQMGNHVVVSNGAQIGGNVTIGDNVTLGGLCAIHQHTRIGGHAFIGGMATVTSGHSLWFCAGQCGAPSRTECCWS
jgi:UDP-N-acetylglucosamine acyltransferase